MKNMEPASHVSFLLRLWKETPDKATVWRASLEDPLTGERKGFATLDALIRFLETLIQPDTRNEEQDDQNPGG